LAKPGIFCLAPPELSTKKALDLSVLKFGGWDPMTVYRSRQLNIANVRASLACAATFQSIRRRETDIISSCDKSMTVLFDLQAIVVCLLLDFGMGPNRGIPSYTRNRRRIGRKKLSYNT
jgi:hypothetical protein